MVIPYMGKTCCIIKLNYSWSEIGRTNLIVYRVITSYNPTLFDNTLMLSPRRNE